MALFTKAIKLEVWVILEFFRYMGSKTITTGEGGVFVTNNTELYEKVRNLNSHGRNPKNPKQFWAETIGFKYKISNLQAAMGLRSISENRAAYKKKKIYIFCIS